MSELVFMVSISPELVLLADAGEWDNWEGSIKYGLQEVFMSVFGGGEIDNSTIRGWVTVKQVVTDLGEEVKE